MRFNSICRGVHGPTLWNELPKELRQFAHPRNPPLNFTPPPLAFSFATFPSRLKTELFKLSYPHSTLTPHHHPPPSIPLTTEARPLQPIVPRFYSSATPPPLRHHRRLQP